MKTLAKSRTYILALLVALSGVGTAPAHASQILDGPILIKAFRIEFNNRVIGAVVVTGSDNPSPPPGYSSGREYWSWMPGAAWPGTFTLVPVNTVPDYYSFSWETRSHEKFDLSRSVPMPSLSLDPGDRFYRVQVHNDSRWIDQGWLWIDGDKRVQEWYGRNLTSDLLGDGTAIRFTSTEPPAPGSCEVYLLIHFPTGGDTLDNAW